MNMQIYANVLPERCCQHWWYDRMPTVLKFIKLHDLNSSSGPCTRAWTDGKGLPCRVRVILSLVESTHKRLYMQIPSDSSVYSSAFLLSQPHWSVQVASLAQGQLEQCYVFKPMHLFTKTFHKCPSADPWASLSIILSPTTERVSIELRSYSVIKHTYSLSCYLQLSFGSVLVFSFRLLSFPPTDGWISVTS